MPITATVSLLLQVTWVRAAVSRMSSCVAMASVFLARGSATVRMNVATEPTNARVPLPPPRLVLAAVPLGRCRAPKPCQPAVFPRPCAATEPGIAPTAPMSPVAPTPPVASVWATSTVPLLHRISSDLTTVLPRSSGAPGCWTRRTPNPLCCRWTCSWGRGIRFTSTTASCSRPSICCRCCRITTTDTWCCWSPAGGR